MRPSPLSPFAALRACLGTLGGVLAGVLAASSVTPATAPAQSSDRMALVDRALAEVGARAGGFGWTVDERDRAVLGISLGSGGRGDTLGVRVVDVVSGGPADKAGIEEGDRITSINGTSLRIAREDAEDVEMGSLANRRLTRALDRLKPGDEVTLGLLRGREARTVKVKTVAADELQRDRSIATIFPGGSGRMSLRAEDLRDSLRARAERRPALGLSVGGTGSRRDTLGLFVSSVTTGGPAEKAGIQEGDRIAAINNVDVRVPREDVEDGMAASARHNRFTRELGRAKPGDNVTLRVYSGGQTRTVTVRAGSAAEVFRDEGGFGIGLGGGTRVITFPEGGAATTIVPRVPLTPRTPVAPRVFYYDNDGASAGRGVRVMPRVEVVPAPRAPAVRVAPSVRRIVTI